MSSGSIEYKQQIYPVSRGESDTTEYHLLETKDLKLEELSHTLGVDHKKLLRKTDWHVIPPFALLYFVVYLNKSSFGLLFVDGVLDTLSILKLQLASAYAAFFCPIIAFQWMANILLRAVKPHFLVLILVLIFGAFNLGCGFAPNYGTFVTMQALHGLFQAGTETTVVYMLSTYYEPREALSRFGGLYSVNCLAGMTINLILLGTNLHLDGSRGLESWRWLMIILGLASMLCAFVLFMVIPDFPENAHFYNDQETIFMVRKLELFSGKSGFNLPTRRKDVFEVLCDPVIFIPGIASLAIGYVSHAYALFEPIIFQGLKFDLIGTNENSAYPWILAFGYVVITAVVSGYFKHRYVFLFIHLVVVVAGALLIFCDTTTNGRSHYKYAGNFLIVSGAYAAMPTLICWTTLNVCGHLRKAVITSLEITIFDIGGLIALFVVVKSDEVFTQGYIVGFCLVIASMLLLSVYLIYLVRANRAKRSALYKETFSEYDDHKKIIMGDKNPVFDYMY